MQMPDGWNIHSLQCEVLSFIASHSGTNNEIKYCNQILYMVTEIEGNYVLDCWIQLRVHERNDTGERNLILIMLAIFFSDFSLLQIYSLNLGSQWEMIFNNTPVEEAYPPLVKVVICYSVVHRVSARPVFFGSTQRSYLWHWSCLFKTDKKFTLPWEKNLKGKR